MPALHRGSAHGRRVIVIGDVTTDIVAVLDGSVAAGSDTAARIQLAGGGQAANTASWLAWCQHPVTLLSSVGDDPFGRTRLAELTELGVDCVFHWCAEAATGTVIVLSQGLERSMLSERGANRQLAAADLTGTITDTLDAGHVHLSGYVLLDASSRTAGLRALAVARDRGLTVSVDAASAQPLRDVGIDSCLSWYAGIDLLLANEAEAAVLTHGLAAEPAARALAAVARNAVVKRGVAGAVWAGPDGLLVSCPAHPASVLDTTGAGDAFSAGLLSALIDGCEVAPALARAAEFGAAAVSRLGGSPAAVAMDRVG